MLKLLENIKTCRGAPYMCLCPLGKPLNPREGMIIDANNSGLLG